MAENTPKTTQRTRLGANAIITCNDKLLLEKRRDSDVWGLVGGGVGPGLRLPNFGQAAHFR